MAIAINSPSGYMGRATLGDDGGTTPTGTISPGANTLVIVFAAVAQEPGEAPSDSPGTMTGLGLTWTQRSNLLYADRRKLYCWTALTGGSAPTPGAISIPYSPFAGGQVIQDLGWVVVEVTGVDVGTPIGSVVTAVQTGGTTAAATITDTPDTGDRVIAAAGFETTASISVENTLVNATGYLASENFRQLSAQWDPDSTHDTTPTFSWAGSSRAGTVAFLLIAQADRTVDLAALSVAPTLFAPVVINSVQLIPDGDGTVTNWTSSEATFWEAVDDNPQVPDAETISTSDEVAQMFLTLSATDTDFGTASSIDVLITHQSPAGQGSLYAQLFAADETTALSDEVLVRTYANTALFVDRVALTGLAAPSKTAMDAARLRLRTVGP